MILSAPSIREVIAFPKNRSAFCPLTQAPAPVSREQLAELALLDMGGAAPLPGSPQQEQDPIDFLSWVARIGIADTERETIRAAVAQAKDLAARAGEQAATNNGTKNAPLYSVLPTANRFRPGTKAEISALSKNGDLLKNAPAVKGGYFKVASVLE